MQKLRYFVKSEKSRAIVRAKVDARAESDEDLEVIEQRVILAAGHEERDSCDEEKLSFG